MRVRYRRTADPVAVLDAVRAMTPRTIIFDVEPLVARWGTGPAGLAAGVGRVLQQVAAATTGVEAVVFATNSPRRLSVEPESVGIRVAYLAMASKPVRTAPYRSLPRPGVVVGDQVATDGVLAWRLGFSFLHYRPAPATVPLGPRVMNHVGRPVRPILFTRGRGPRI